MGEGATTFSAQYFDTIIMRFFAGANGAWHSLIPAKGVWKIYRSKSTQLANIADEPGCLLETSTWCKDS
jgi:hypothetical protein